MNLGEKLLWFFKYFDEPEDLEGERAKQDELKILLVQEKLLQETEEDQEEMSQGSSARQD
jgi:hypothetical protein